ncbi:hypothetical protein SAMN05421739_1148 [Pontibacter chinhatensis]|uniref:Uncharacterized protein n=1 Tax=Pontibacter chinhatensis TaxID=1436961 RepID=A0A1I2ZHE9_9BACT|nr:hypothetical protein SAMN05421739_1148 [Pontibacter chinhatensis]
MLPALLIRNLQTKATVTWPVPPGYKPHNAENYAEKPSTNNYPSLEKAGGTL